MIRAKWATEKYLSTVSVDVIDHLASDFAEQIRKGIDDLIIRDLCGYKSCSLDCEMCKEEYEEYKLKLDERNKTLPTL